jgi:glycosyltransferase involved in cell wall biosynthesis
MNSIPVNWYPAHPSGKSVSMMQYWRFLQGQLQEQDKYSCRSVVKMPPEDWSEKRSKAKICLSRQVTYPLIARLASHAKLGHVLDHAWADVLNYMPTNMAKVVTVHDLIPLRYPGELSARQLKRFGNRVSHLTTADLLICVSHYTANEVQELLHVPPEKIVVVPNGVTLPPKYVEPTWVRDAINRRHIGLRVGCLGSVLQRKNIGILPKAVQAAAAELGEAITVVRAGACVSSKLRQEFIDVIGINNFIELGRLSNDELEDFYSNIDVIVVPSFYEGFGLPVLEAMARGVPVISSDASSLPEVAGDAALYFDPHRPDQMAERLVQLADNEVSDRMIHKGLERADQFSWRSSLEGIYRAYDKVLGI